MSGMADDTRGMESAIMTRKTVNANSTEIPSEISINQSLITPKGSACNAYVRIAIKQ